MINLLSRMAAVIKPEYIIMTKRYAEIQMKMDKMMEYSVCIEFEYRDDQTLRPSFSMHCRCACIRSTQDDSPFSVTQAAISSFSGRQGASTASTCSTSAAAGVTLSELDMMMLLLLLLLWLLRQEI